MDAFNDDHGFERLENTDETVDETDVAAAMGFGSFGAKPHLAKKRKTAGSEKTGSGSNSLPLGMTRERDESQIAQSSAVEEGQQMQRDSQEIARQGDGSEKAPQPGTLGTGLDNRHHMSVGSNIHTVYSQAGQLPNGQWDWQALRRGVRNEHGDMAYYDASFVEDPWALLRKRIT